MEEIRRYKIVLHPVSDLWNSVGTFYDCIRDHQLDEYLKLLAADLICRCYVIIMNEQISMREAFGCIIMFAAILLAQIPAKKKVTGRISEKAETILNPEME